MSFTNLKINQNIEIEICEGPYQGKYLSKVSEINEKQVVIMALYDKRYLPLRKNLAVKIFFKGDDAFYSFNSRVKRRIKKPIPLLILNVPQEVERIQRRDFFRLKTQEDVYYRLQEKNNGNKDYIKTKMLDISGSGLKILLNRNLTVGEKIELILTIDSLENMPIIARVVRTGNLTNRSEKFAGVDFIDLERDIQDKIISWMFDYQRDLLNKGMM